MVELTATPPRILLAGHLDGDAPVLVYRVADLRGAMKELEARGWKRAGTFEIPSALSARSSRRAANIRHLRALAPEVEAHFAGRFDF